MTPDSTRRRQNGDTSRGSGRARDLGGIASTTRARFENLTGLVVESMSGAAREDGNWRLSFEVLELQRIPDSTSLLGTYEVVANGDGAIVGFSRVRRYYRNRADEEDGY